MERIQTRIDEMLAKRTVVRRSAARVVEQTPDQRLQNSLSGALRCKVVVETVDGVTVAHVPISAIMPSGLRLVENAIPGGQSILAGSIKSVAGAERRIARFCGESFGSRLVSFNSADKTAMFEIINDLANT